jgi:hypothetical protein
MKLIYMEGTLNYLVGLGLITEEIIREMMSVGKVKTTEKKYKYLVVNDLKSTEI